MYILAARTEEGRVGCRNNGVASWAIATPGPFVCIMRTMKSAELIRDLKAAGWILDRVRGSHHVFKHLTRSGHVVVPHPKKDLGNGLVAAIRKQAGL